MKKELEKLLVYLIPAVVIEKLLKTISSEVVAGLVIPPKSNTAQK
jgi:hypothetical protein